MRKEGKWRKDEMGGKKEKRKKEEKGGKSVVGETVKEMKMYTNKLILINPL